MEGDYDEAPVRQYARYDPRCSVLGGAAPMAAATPVPSPTPTEVVGSADDQLDPIYTTAKPPKGPTDPELLFGPGVCG